MDLPLVAQALEQVEAVAAFHARAAETAPWGEGDGESLVAAAEVIREVWMAASRSRGWLARFQEG